MPRLAPVSPKKLIRLLEREGFECIRTKGSHQYFLNKADGRTTVIPLHGNRDIGRGLLKLILKDVSWSVEEFNAKMNR